MKNIIYWIIGLGIVGGLIVLLVREAQRPGKYDTFAQCLGEKGATFYGTFWCPVCQKQKALFGRSAKKLPYTECSTRDGKGQLQICTDAGIDRYPTWVFADGSRISGAQEIQTLSEKTECPITIDGE